MAPRRTASNVYALDTDTLTLHFRGHPQITRRVLSAPQNSLWLPAPVVEEQLRGRLSTLSGLNATRAADSRKLPQAYQDLLETAHALHGFQHLAYTPEAEALFQSWPTAVKRVGTRDCRIAATAIVHGFTVITCNLSHFQTIPGVKLEDWSH